MSNKVLVVATSRKTHGGIASVVKAHEQGPQWQKFRCKWLPVHRDGPKLRKILYLISGLLQYIVLLPFYNMVHIHMSTDASAKRKVLFFKLAKLMHKPIIVHLHCGTQIEKQWSTRLDYIFKNADNAFVLSESIKRIVATHTGKSDNLTVCYNPCPKVRLRPNVPKKNIILFAAYLAKNKGYDTLINAFAKIAADFPNWKLVIAGTGEVEIAKSMIEERGLQNQIQIKGWVKGTEKEQLFRESAILCLASYQEGFPMSVLEAFAYGIAVISTPVGGIPDIAKNGDNMLLFRPGDTDALANNLVQLMSNQSLRETLSQHSLKLAHTIFSQNEINKQIDKVYEQLLRQ